MTQITVLSRPKAPISLADLRWYDRLLLGITAIILMAVFMILFVASVVAWVIGQIVLGIRWLIAGSKNNARRL